MKRFFIPVAVIAAFFFLSFTPMNAHAIKELQLYIEGATYFAGGPDGPNADTWVSTSSSFKLWVLGDVSATVNSSGILDVKLSAAYLEGETGTITITPITTALVADPSTPGSPTLITSSGTGQPTMGDGSALASHGVYGAGVNWYEWGIGNFTLLDSPIGDVITTFPSSFPDTGQINAYNVTVTGYSMVHFDAYDHIMKNNNDADFSRYIFAPFSHDATGGGTPVPEPGTMMLLGSGLVGLAGWGRKKFRK